ncbi:hypothetical protein BGZ98_007669 [Dissophora globulifera]|nr:hypothetical protein BGZ98_007669 [Dissophora globulifera]
MSTQHYPTTTTPLVPFLPLSANLTALETHPTSRPHTPPVPPVSSSTPASASLQLNSSNDNLNSSNAAPGPSAVAQSEMLEAVRLQLQDFDETWHELLLSYSISDSEVSDCCETENTIISTKTRQSSTKAKASAKAAQDTSVDVSSADTHNHENRRVRIHARDRNPVQETTPRSASGTSGSVNEDPPSKTSTSTMTKPSSRLLSRFTRLSNSRPIIARVGAKSTRAGDSSSEDSDHGQENGYESDSIKPQQSCTPLPDPRQRCAQPGEQEEQELSQPKQQRQQKRFAMLPAVPEQIAAMLEDDSDLDELIDRDRQNTKTAIPKPATVPMFMQEEEKLIPRSSLETTDQASPLTLEKGQPNAAQSEPRDELTSKASTDAKSGGRFPGDLKPQPAEHEEQSGCQGQDQEDELLKRRPPRRPSREQTHSSTRGSHQQQQQQQQQQQTHRELTLPPQRPPRDGVGTLDSVLYTISPSLPLQLHKSGATRVKPHLPPQGFLMVDTRSHRIRTDPSSAMSPPRAQYTLERAEPTSPSSALPRVKSGGTTRPDASSSSRDGGESREVAQSDGHHRELAGHRTRRLSFTSRLFAGFWRRKSMHARLVSTTALPVSVDDTTPQQQRIQEQAAQRVHNDRQSDTPAAAALEAAHSNPPHPSTLQPSQIPPLQPRPPPSSVLPLSPSLTGVQRSNKSPRYSSPPTSKQEHRLDNSNGHSTSFFNRFSQGCERFLCGFQPMDQEDRPEQRQTHQTRPHLQDHHSRRPQEHHQSSSARRPSNPPSTNSNIINTHSANDLPPTRIRDNSGDAAAGDASNIRSSATPSDLSSSHSSEWRAPPWLARKLMSSSPVPSLSTGVMPEDPVLGSPRVGSQYSESALTGRTAVPSMISQERHDIISAQMGSSNTHSAHAWERNSNDGTSLGGSDNFPRSLFTEERPLCIRGSPPVAPFSRAARVTSGAESSASTKRDTLVSACEDVLLEPLPDTKAVVTPPAESSA